MCRLLLLFSILFSSLPAAAQTIELTLGEVRQALDGADEATALEPLMLAQLQAAEDAAGLQWDGDRLRWSRTLTEHPLATGCAYSAMLERLDLSLELAPSSRLSLEFTSLQAPWEVTLSAPVALQGTGQAEQAFGVSAFGRCGRYGRDGFDLTLDGAGRFELRLRVLPGVTRNGRQLTVAPSFDVSIAWRGFDYDVSVDHSRADSLLESRIRDEVDALFSPAAADEMARRLKQALQQRIVDAWGGPAFSVELAGLDDAALTELDGLLEQTPKTPAAERYLRDHAGRLWHAVLTGDRKSGGNVLAAAALCELVAQKTLPVRAAPLYRKGDGGCEQVEPATIEETGQYFADAVCRQPAHVAPLGLQQYCRNDFDPLRVGNGALLPGDDSAPWTLSPGTRADLALVSSRDLPQPWTTSRVYRRIDTDAGECVLEMRVYKNRIDATGLKPLLALHGGNWRFRTRGVLGIEAIVPQFTSRGFVVFAPFYRLAGDSEGTEACHDASGEEILADVDAALAWVQAHGAAFGAEGGQVAVTGQSAGAHLAAWLAVHRPEQVSRALLFYPPTDMADYLRQWRDGLVDARSDGIDAVAGFLRDHDPANVDLSLPLIRDNSLPRLVARQPAHFPPMFIVHGSADRVVPLRQAVRLCNALAGDPEQGPATDDVSASVAFACDRRGSRLQVVAGADHALDICPSPLWCPAGDEAARQAARAALVEGYDWLAAPRSRVAGATETRQGGGAMSLLLLLLPLSWRQRRGSCARQSSATVPRSETTPSSNSSQRTSRPAANAACTTLPT